MTKEDAAAKLNGSQYTEEGSPELFAEMKSAGLVAVFGASDDLMELRGAIDDEIGAWDGGTALVTAGGLLQNCCEEERCPYFLEIAKKAAAIEAKWDAGTGFAWTYETEIPHAKFTVFEDDEQFCEGIVFALADVSA